MSEEFDLSKEFVRTYIDKDGYYVLEMNTPNDVHGDMAFEWDIDGSQRQAWDRYIKKLEDAGIRGKLVLKTIRWKYNPAFDGPIEKIPKKNA